MKKNGWIAALLLCAASAAPRAGEIIILPVPDGATSGAAAAAANRNSARAFQQEGNPPAAASIVIVPDGEADLFLPRGGEILSPERVRARQYQRDERQPATTLLIVPKGLPGKAETNREHLEDNRAKARSYMKGQTPAGVALSDGLPVVLCRDVDNVSGRIGDDSRAGNVITIIQNGQRIKVRCSN